MSILDPFAVYNTHQANPARYWEADPQLRALKTAPHLYHNPLINQLPTTEPGVYTLGGGRQIGKTTLLKQWVAELLAAQINPQHIMFFTGELIDDHHQLLKLIEAFISLHTTDDRTYIVIDEITYVKQWDRAIKFAADAGYFSHAVVMLTGSDLTLMQSARMTFPGRRGKSAHVDFHLYPLSFRETVHLKQCINAEDDITDPRVMKQLFHAFEAYLLHGGYLTAINDMAQSQMIHAATLQTYADWIRGDMAKRGKQEQYLKEILAAIIARYNKQLTWHNLSDALSIDSPKTIADYCDLLASMDALFIQYALLIDKKAPAPKKARKMTFTDPFIYHAIQHWLSPTDQPHKQILETLKDPHHIADIVEATVSNHYKRQHPTYYIKADGEIDLAYIDQDDVWPIEIKWRNQLRPHDLKQIKKYPHGRILTKLAKTSIVDGVSIEPLPVALYQLGA